jgi:transposase
MGPLAIYISMLVFVLVVLILVRIYHRPATRLCHLCGARVEIGKSRCQVCGYQFE